jgi:pimeloyl-ACP methyl ester carboxylesterase
MFIPPTSQSLSIEIDGARLEAQRWPGQGTPILLLHEGLGCIAMWRDFPEKLAAATGRPVAAWSRRGFGRSAPFAGKPALDYLHRDAALLPAVMDALGLERAHLFGHSDGASIALIAGGPMHARIASLIIEAPHVFVEDVTVAGVAKVRAAYETTNLKARLARYHDDADAVFRNWNDTWLDPAFRGWNIEDCLPAIAAPTLLIQGLDDEYATLAQLARIAAVVRDSERLEPERCGHSPHRDQEAVVLAATKAFLDRAEAA